MIGVSPDPVARQAKFKTKLGLPFTLLSDAGHSAAEAFGVWKEKSMYGKKYMGIERSTFIIAKDGKIKNIFLRVKPEGHAADILESLHH